MDVTMMSPVNEINDKGKDKKGNRRHNKRSRKWRWVRRHSGLHRTWWGRACLHENTRLLVGS